MILLSHPVHGLSTTHMFVVLNPSLKFHLTVLSFDCWNSHRQITSSEGQDVVVTCRQTPDTPLLLSCLHVYKHTDSRPSDYNITYITQHTHNYSVLCFICGSEARKHTIVESCMNYAQTGSQSDYLQSNQYARQHILDYIRVSENDLSGSLRGTQTKL